MLASHARFAYNNLTEAMVPGKRGNNPMTHLEVLNFRLFNERARLATAKTSYERNQRAVWVAQIEREIAGEIAFLAKADDLSEMSDDELLKALQA